MSFKRNILASYASQAYVSIVSIFILPMYLNYMGAESYGLVGFFTMLQASFNLLDLGLSPTVARETARFRGGAINALHYRRLLRALQIIFFGIALVGGGAMFAFSGLVAERWLNVQTLSLAQVQVALQLMAMSVVLRWISGFYRGCIFGSECLVWLGGYNAVMATLRFVAVLPILMWHGNSLFVFFIYQLIVALIELAGLIFKSNLILPVLPKKQSITFKADLLFATLRPSIRYSSSIAFTAFAWVLITQIDKLILSNFLSLTDYGYFTLATTLAAGIMVLSAPFTGPLTMRMTALYAEKKHIDAIELYTLATRVVVIIVGPVAIILMTFPKSILYAWTRDLHVVEYGSDLLSLYTFGFLFAMLSAFPSYIQHAVGDMRYHFKGSLIFLIIFLPAIYMAAYYYNSNGAGVAWALVNFIFFMVWVKFVHDKLIPSFHAKWMLISIAKPLMLAVIFAVTSKYFLHNIFGEFLNIWQISAVGLCLFLVMIKASMSLDVIRSFVGLK